jgi:hypothetical protein
VPGAKITEVTRRDGTAASVVFTWRQARTVEKAGLCFTSVQVTAAETSEHTAKVVPEDGGRGRSVAVARAGLIEIDLGTQQRIRWMRRLTRIGAGARRSGTSMIPIPGNVRVWLATGHTDMRRGFPNLARLVQEDLKQNPNLGDLYVYRGRRGEDLGRIWTYVRDDRPFGDRNPPAAACNRAGVRDRPCKRASASCWQISPHGSGSQ